MSLATRKFIVLVTFQGSFYVAAVLLGSAASILPFLGRNLGASPILASAYYPLFIVGSIFGGLIPFRIYRKTHQLRIILFVLVFIQGLLQATIAIVAQFQLAAAPEIYAVLALFSGVVATVAFVLYSTALMRILKAHSMGLILVGQGGLGSLLALGASIISVGLTKSRGDFEADVELLWVGSLFMMISSAVFAFLAPFNGVVLFVDSVASFSMAEKFKDRRFLTLAKFYLKIGSSLVFVQTATSFFILHSATILGLSRMDSTASFLSAGNIAAVPLWWFFAKRMAGRARIFAVSTLSVSAGAIAISAYFLELSFKIYLLGICVVLTTIAGQAVRPIQQSWSMDKVPPEDLLAFNGICQGILGAVSAVFAFAIGVLAQSGSGPIPVVIFTVCTMFAWLMADRSISRKLP